MSLRKYWLRKGLIHRCEPSEFKEIFKEILDDFQLGKSRPWYPYGHCLQPGFFFDRAR